MQVNHLESINKSQGVYGETLEHQYRMALSELESLRDENANLKTKIRRQYREIELLKRIILQSKRRIASIQLHIISLFLFLFFFNDNISIIY